MAYDVFPTKWVTLVKYAWQEKSSTILKLYKLNTKDKQLESCTMNKTLIQCIYCYPVHSSFFNIIEFAIIMTPLYSIAWNLILEVVSENNHIKGS